MPFAEGVSNFHSPTPSPSYSPQQSPEGDGPEAVPLPAATPVPAAALAATAPAATAAALAPPVVPQPPLALLPSMLSLPTVAEILADARARAEAEIAEEAAERETARVRVQQITEQARKRAREVGGEAETSMAPQQRPRFDRELAAGVPAGSTCPCSQQLTRPPTARRPACLLRASLWARLQPLARQACSSSRS